MHKFIVAIILLFPTIAQAQSAYRFSSVQITSTADGALVVAGGVTCCGGRLQLDATTGDLIDPGGTVVGVREALHVIPTTQAINTDPLFGMATQWNSSGNVFTGVDLNIQGTAYNASSLLMNLRLNNTSVFNVTPAGNVNFAGVLTGNGSGLTNFSAAQLATGTVPAARLSGTYTINVSGGSFSGTTVTGSTGTFSGALTSNGGTSTFAAASVSGALAIGGNTTATGSIFSSSTIYNTGQIYPGRVDTTSSQLSWYLGSHATYGLYTNTGMYFSGPIYTTILYDSNSPTYFIDLATNSRIGTVTIGDASTSGMVGNWDFTSGGLGGGSPILKPVVDNAGSIGTNSARWNLIRGVTVQSGDMQFENGWTITESYKVGIAQAGLAILDENESLVMFIPKPDKTHPLPYVRTSKAQRARMDPIPNERQRSHTASSANRLRATTEKDVAARIERSPAVEPMPDPKRARVGGGK